MLPHHDTHKFTLTSLIEKTHNQADYIFIDKTWHSNVLVVRSSRVVDFDSDHCLVVVKVSKQTEHKFHKKDYNIKKLNEVEGKEQYWSEF
jgi:hypothetical protein